MLPLKLVRSLVLGDSIHGETHQPKLNQKTPLLLFIPTRELITDTYRLATIARDMGLDLYPTPSLSHIVFSFTSSSSSPPATPFLWSSTSLSPLPNDAVPLPFPSFATAPIAHLRSFVALTKGLFKLVYLNSCYSAAGNGESIGSNWDCCSFSLFSRLTRDRIGSMDAFSRALAGAGWTLFNTRKNPSKGGGKMVYLFRKVDSKRVRVRVRELRLPPLDFRNAPLRILHYILLMADDLFYLA